MAIWTAIHLDKKTKWTTTRPSDETGELATKFGEGFSDDRTATVASATTGTYEKEVLKLSDWPETKTTSVKKCKKILGRKACINWPQIWRRSSRLVVVLVVTYPKGAENEVKKCAKTALTGAIVTALAGGNFAAAAAAFKTVMVACLATKGSEAANKITIKFDGRKIPGRWKKI